MSISKLTVSAALMAISLAATAQQGGRLSMKGGETVFINVQQPPQYVDNGMEGLIDFIDHNLRYPTLAKKNKIEGNVHVSFIVEKDGSLSEVEIDKGVEKSLNEEAIRLVKLTKWKPGIQNGNIVRTNLVVAIKYKI